MQMTEAIAAVDNWDPSQDAVVSAPRNHRVIFEDEDVRILRVILPPGEPEPLHHHRWPSIFVIDHIEPIRDFDASGIEQIPPKAILDAVAREELPIVVRMPPQALHSVENVGIAAITGTRIEFKHGFSKIP